MTVSNARRALAPLFAAGLCAAACGTGHTDPSLQSSASDALNSENGLSINGITTNGITTNGITTNGITTNGITTNGLAMNGVTASGMNNGLPMNGLTAAGLAAPEFSAWFTATAPGYGDMVMRYLVRCALPASASLSYRDSHGVSHTWQGNLDLAPQWASGWQIAPIEQELITACLLAHANRYNLHVNVSVRGLDAYGWDMPVTYTEQQQFTFLEGCFFGNLFTGEGEFSSPALPSSMLKGVSSARDCALMSGGPNDCPPMVSIGGNCGAICSGNTRIYNNGSNNGGAWSDCYANGRWYAALTTYLRPADVAHCGDGVCQFPETCYNASTGVGCLADCGACH